MRELIQRSRHWLKVGWFWPLVLLALPNCFLDATGIGTPPALEPGSNPTSAIMCDIPKFTEVAPNCAQPEDEQYRHFLRARRRRAGQRRDQRLCAGLLAGPRRVQRRAGEDGVLWIVSRRLRRLPELRYPDTRAVPDANDVCIAQCKDLFTFSEGPAPSDITAFCNANATVSTNFNKSTCFDEACESGTLKSDFADPRRVPEPVIWHDLFGTAAPGNLLKRTAPTTGNDDVDYNAGAASKQVISGGDGWLEFEAAETDLGHVVGLSESCDGCSDDDPSISDVQFGISLNLDGRVYVIESGVFVPGPDVNNSYGTYTANERFRVVVTDNNDGTATVSHYRVTGSCSPGTPCPTTSSPRTPAPLRIRYGSTRRSASRTQRWRTPPSCASSSARRGLMKTKRIVLVAGGLSAVVLAAGRLSAIVASAQSAPRIDLRPLVVTNLGGTLSLIQEVPCGQVVHVTTAATGGRAELTPSEGIPNTRTGGRTFTMTRLNILYKPFSVNGECQGFRDPHNVTDIGVTLAGAVTFDVEPDGDFVIPKEDFLLKESFVDNKKAKTAYKKPSEDVTGNLNLAGGTMRIQNRHRRAAAVPRRLRPQRRELHHQRREVRHAEHGRPRDARVSGHRWRRRA